MILEFPDGWLTRRVTIDDADGEVLLSDVLEATDGGDFGVATNVGWPPEQARTIGLAIVAHAEHIMRELAGAAQPVLPFERRAA